MRNSTVVLGVTILLLLMFSLILVTTIPIMPAQRTDISDFPTGPSSGYVGETLFFISDISLCDISREVLYYEWDWECCQSGKLIDGRTASKVWSNHGTYDVKVRADTGIIRRDEYGNPVSIRDKQTTNWSPALTVTILEVNNPPNTPSKPSGPSSGTVGISYGFLTSATDLDGDKVQYLFDWGDGTESSWTGLVSSGNQGSSSNTWYSPGTYSIRTQAKDEHATTSGWSKTIYITILEVNNPPNTPSKPSGPSSGTVGISYGFLTSATDLDGDKVQYLFDWDDGETTTTDFLPNGTATIQTHSWATAGEYTISVKAYDNETESGTAEYTVLIDVWLIDDEIKGYLVDENGDGEYDLFDSSETGEKITIEKQDDGTYLIDSDGDGEWDYTFSMAEGLSVYEKEENGGTPGFELILVVCALILVLFRKRKRK